MFLVTVNNCRQLLCYYWLLVCWHSDKCICHINKVKLRRARLVLGLVTTFGGSTIPLFTQATQSFHPSVGRCNEYRRWFRPSLGRNGASEVMTLRHFKSVYKCINCVLFSCTVELEPVFVVINPCVIASF